MLLGLVREGQGVGVQVLQQLGVDIERVREEVLSQVAQSPSDVPGPGAGPERGRGWRALPGPGGLPLPFFRGQKQGDAPYCPGCGTGLKGNLRYVHMSAEGVEPGAPALGLVCTYCTSCGFPVGWGAGAEGAQHES